MKKVLSSLSDIAHLFANQLQDEARNSNNSFFFRGNTIYSYGSHFPIAKHIEYDGKEALLFTLRSYSNTTAKHINYVAHAVNHKNIIYCGNPNNTHTDNFNYWLGIAEDICKSLLKAKKPEIYLNKLANIESQVNRYAKFFCIAVPENLSFVLSTQDKAQFADYEAKKEAFRLAEEKRQQKELKAAHKKELVKWLNMETSRLYNRSNVDYLRLNSDIIETSQGVKIDLINGKRFYEAILNNTLQVGQHLLGYEVLSIDKKSIKIGCHNFELTYLKQFGEKVFK